MANEESTDEVRRDDPFQQLKEWILLRERAVKAELRLLVIGTIIANQALDHISVPSTVTVGAVILFAVKGLAVLRSGG